MRSDPCAQADVCSKALFHEKPLPSNASLKVERRGYAADGPAAPQSRIPAVVPIVCWISTSMGVILFNKHLLADSGFDKPCVRSSEATLM